eukprot:1175608-Prorocentrum_minimum.AAC.1
MCSHLNDQRPSHKHLKRDAPFCAWPTGALEVLRNAGREFPDTAAELVKAPCRCSRSRRIISRHVLPIAIEWVLGFFLNPKRKFGPMGRCGKTMVTCRGQSRAICSHSLTVPVGIPTLAPVPPVTGTPPASSPAARPSPHVSARAALDDSTTCFAFWPVCYSAVCRSLMAAKAPPHAASCTDLWVSMPMPSRYGKIYSPP